MLRFQQHRAWIGVVLDTLKLHSPWLDAAAVRAIMVRSQRTQRVDMETGEVVWEFTTGKLSGTWDHRIGVRLQDTKWKQAEPNTAPVQVRCKPFLEVEGSVHKALLGHNVFGGPTDLEPSARWLIDLVGEQFGAHLPPAETWRYRRVDWAECYELPSFEVVSEFLGYMRNATFTRRGVNVHQGPAGSFTGVHVPGGTSTVKLYHKGPEFQKHDRKRVLAVGRQLGKEEEMKALCTVLQHRANVLLRCEVEIHARTLDDQYYNHPGPAVGLPQTVEWVQSLYDREMARVLREGASDMSTVRTAMAVKQRLFEVYSARQARALYGTWLELSAVGEDSVREGMRRRQTFWHHRKLLEEAGCSWHGGDVKLDTRARLVPEDFSPVRSDPRRLTGEAPQVALALGPYRELVA